MTLPIRTFPTAARRLGLSGNARIDTVRQQGKSIEANLGRCLGGRTSQQAEICALKIGDWTLVSVPGEAFNDLAQSLSQASPEAIVTGYTNDYLGYFPTQAAIDEATYEALSSPFDARAHILLRSHLVELLRRVRPI